ncbi:hypothetical protein H5410_017406 [Solanum commersonii]|uniref:Uncharacterized protein n=1 Tax=Solanum commersonii TaxID=4109 RepID=A0A9J5ZZ00_SOLCO|nr:hypothetical protein H5410_017406 [Solanum commersonii]
MGDELPAQKLFIINSSKRFDYGEVFLEIGGDKILIRPILFLLNSKRASELKWKSPFPMASNTSGSVATVTQSFIFNFCKAKSKFCPRPLSKYASTTEPSQNKDIFENAKALILKKIDFGGKLRKMASILELRLWIQLTQLPLVTYPEKLKRTMLLPLNLKLGLSPDPLSTSYLFSFLIF